MESKPEEIKSNELTNNNPLSSQTLKLDTSSGIVGFALVYIQPEQLLCVGTKDGHILTYDINDFKLINKYSSAHQGWVISLTYNSALGLLISTSTDKTIKLFKVKDRTLTEQAKLEGHKDNVNGVLVIPELSIMYSCGRDPDIKVWDLDHFKLKTEIPTGEGGMGCSIIEIKEMKCIGASFSTGKIKFYSIDTNQWVFTIDTENPNYYINSLLYLPTRKWIVAQISAKEIKIWKKTGDEFVSGEKIRTEGHANFIVVDKDENTIMFACDKPYVDIQELNHFSRTKKLDLSSTPLKNSNGLVYIPELSIIIISAWNSPYLHIRKLQLYDN